MMKKITILRSFYNLIVLLLLAAGVYLVVNHFVHFGDGEFTDNATMQRQITPVNTRVSGFIKEIRFEEFQQVHKGDTLSSSRIASFACVWPRLRPTWPMPWLARR